MSSHYETLEISSDATPDQIKRSWARLVRLHPPDQDPEGNRRINEAKRVLLDSVARADYDSQLHYGDELNELFEQASDHMFEEDFAAAVPLFKEIIALHPTSKDARNQLGLCFAYLEEFQDATNCLRGLVDMAPDSSLYASNLGHAYRMWAHDDSSQLAQAEKWFRRAIELESHNSAHYIALAKTLSQDQKFNEALEILERAVVADGKVDVDDVDTMVEIALVNVLAKKGHEVKNVAQRVKRMLPDDIEVQRYAAFKFLTVAHELVDIDLIKQAGYFSEAAQTVCSDLGDMTEYARNVNKWSGMFDEAMRMLDSKIEPKVVPSFFGLMAGRKLGQNIDDVLIEQLIEAAQTWSQQDLRRAINECMRQYPLVMAEFSEHTQGFVDLGYYQPGQSRTPASHSHGYQTRPSASTGCILPLVTLASLLLSFAAIAGILLS